MRPSRRFLKVSLAAVAPMMLLGVLTVGGNTAWANGSHAKNSTALKGTTTCTSFTATLNFNPPEQPVGPYKTKETETVTASTLGGCVSSPSGGPTSATGDVLKPIKSKSNACSSLESGSTSKTSFTIDWPSAAPSKVTFSGVADTTTGYSLTNGKVTGSYATKNGASGTINIAQGSITAIATCIGGSGGDISSISISGGSFTL